MGHRESPQKLTPVGRPYSPEAEAAVIGAMLLDPEETFAAVGETLIAEHFFDPFCRAAYTKALELLREGVALDSVSLAAKLDGNVKSVASASIVGRLGQIAETYPSTTNVGAWAALITEKAVERKLAAAGTRFQQLAHMHGVPACDKVAEADRMIAELGAEVDRGEPLSCAEMVAEAMATVERNMVTGRGITGVTTGIDALDALTCGLQKGELIVVAGRPSMGKTSFALTIAFHNCAAAQENNALPAAFFSLEMAAPQLGMRWLSTSAGVPLSHLKSGRVSAQDWDQLQSVFLEAQAVPLEIDVRSDISLQAIQARARRLKREKRLGIIFVDYLQMIGDDAQRRETTTTERVTEISRGLKRLAKELDIPVVALSQLNRTLESRQDKRPIMSDLRESGAIEQDADLIIFIYRDEVYNPDSMDKGSAELIVAKQRNGATGTVRCGFDGTTTTFTNSLPNLYAGPLQRRERLETGDQNG